jgi:hypothetical protein
MNESILHRINDAVDRLNMKYGKCSIELDYHDGRIVYFVLTSSSRTNIESSYQGKEAGDGHGK